MGRPPDPDLAVLDEAILTILASARAPVSTTTIAAIVDLHVADHRLVYQRLHGLEQRGQVVRVRRPGRRVTSWALHTADVDTGGRL